MKWFKELKVSHKLYLLVALASFFILLTSTIGYFFNARTTKALEVIYRENLIAIADIGDLGSNMNHLLANTLNLFQQTSDAENKALLEDNELIKDDSNKKFQEFENTNPSEQVKRKLETFKVTRSNFWEKINPAIELAKNNRNQEAYAIYKSNLHNVKKYRDELSELQNMQRSESKEIFESSLKATQTANVLLMIIGFASLLLMVSLGIVIASAITKPIQQAIGELTTGSSEVSAASSQVEAASHSLAEGTTEQAASIQETSSTLEETSSMVQQNNENTKQAVILAKSAKEYAQKSNQEMATMMVSMSDLKQSSNEIAKIIKVIDEIAFQTNLLSLNAAVEAARAGDAGKGFAVVAEEVRSLAQRSAQAAKDTAFIIEKNISLSEDSAKIAKDVNESLSQIDDEAKKVSELLEEISTATDEQARGINEINKAIQQMEQVMQSNSATADESAAASKELASQALNVNDIVYSLVRLVEGVNDKNASSQLLVNQARKHHQITQVHKYKNNPKAITQKENPENIIPLNDF